MPRCPWATDPLLIEYHDEEWGVPVHDVRRHFEMLTLEGAQAGLSWRTVLAKRDAYRDAYAGFDPVRVAAFDDDDVEQMLQNAGLIRNRAKLTSAIGNAKALLQLEVELGSFDDYLWGYVDDRPIVNHFETIDELPAQTELSTRISADLRRRGFRFVGPTTCYAHLQAAGLVNDHLVSCPRRRALD